MPQIIESTAAKGSIPEEAVVTSHDAKIPTLRKVPSVPQADKYSDERVSPNQPTDEDAQNMAPDDDVKPG